MIPEIDNWRVANLMLTRYGDEATAEGTKRAEELAEFSFFSASTPPKVAAYVQWGMAALVP